MVTLIKKDEIERIKYKEDVDIIYTVDNRVFIAIKGSIKEFSTTHMEFRYAPKRNTGGAR